jgi:tight adherence protein C
MLPVLISAMAASSVLLLFMWYARSKNRQEERLRVLLEPQRMIVEQQDPFTQRVAFPVIDGLINFVMAILPTALVLRSRVWLVSAGDRLSLTQFLTIVVMTSAGFMAAPFLLLTVLFGGSIAAVALLTTPLFGFMGMLLPFALLRRSARQRQRTIWKAMPNALDFMTTCVEAGLSLDFALQRVSERYKGPLSDEINRALREMGLGKTRREALSDMAARIGVEDVNTFINSLLQAEALGTSIGQVLRVQAAQMRMRRRQQAENIARQAPVKMVIPLVVFLMPSLFIVTLGPVILNVIRTFNEN